MTLIVHAPNIHQGGGLTLLLAILDELKKHDDYKLVIDSRLAIQDSSIKSNIAFSVEPTFIGRLVAEFKLYRMAKKGYVVLCFGNLPPLLKLSCYVMVFIQNRYLIDNIRLNEFSLKIRIKFIVERIWLAIKIKNGNEYIVQTPTMKKLLEAKIYNRVPVTIVPFVADPSGYRRKYKDAIVQKNNGSNFLYIASGEPHKNHHRIIEAWRVLAEEGFFPSLHLTLDKDRFKSMCKKLNLLSDQYNLNITNMGHLSHHEVLKLYKSADVLIYPSSFESLGLPLIEARQAGIQVIAAELDYVRDLIDPEESFNPDSSISIARAVKRFMGVNEPLLPLFHVSGFIKHVMKQVS